MIASWKLALLGATALVCLAASALLPHITSAIDSSAVHELMVINPDSQMYAGWVDPPIQMHQKFYFFDVQNKDEILQGAKPVVRQIGPYTYRTHMPKENITWNDNFTVSYVEPQIYIFNRSMSVGDENDTFTSVNLPLMTMIHMMESLPGFLQRLMEGLIKDTKEKLFMELSVKDLIWGYPEPLFKKLQPLAGKKLIPSDHFGFLMGRNNSNVGIFTVFTGEDDRSKLNVVDRWAGNYKLDYWNTEIANMINGTDGSMYHPYVNKSEVLYIFTPDMCRSMPYEYEEDTTYEGVTLLHFPLTKYAYENGTDYPPNEGFCKPECLPSGLLSVGACRGGAPMSVSNPHFYNGDPMLAEAIGGLSPSKELHENFLDMEPKMGLPWRFAERLQLNIYVEKNPNIHETGNVQSNHFPVLWFEERVQVTDDIVRKYKNGFILPNIISFYMKFVLFAVAGILIIVLVVILVKRQTKLKNPEVVKKNIQSEDGDPEKKPLLG
ncbi:scavenger receptor class B member 1-like isoform X2 [Ptychodera flava]|uniref:scavenger receptor class B member 1-like isoform X2 n=1 Tax=Ptychodera flava TaxID=63121 RepID=UPI00396A5DA7